MAAVKEKETERQERESASKKPFSPLSKRLQQHSKEEQDRYETRKLWEIVWRRLLKYEDPVRIDGLETTELMSRLAAQEGGNLPLEEDRPNLQ